MKKRLMWAGLLAFPVVGAFLACGDSSSPGSSGSASGSASGSHSGTSSGSSSGGPSSGSVIVVGTSGNSGSSAGTGSSSSGAAMSGASGSSTGGSSGGIGFLLDSGLFSLDGGFTPTGTCLVLSNCCATLSSSLLRPACDLALSLTGNDQTLCAQELAAFQEAGICH